MLKYKKIMVPYDGSEHAKNALLHACDLASAAENATIYIASICNMVAAMSNFDQVSIAEGCLTTTLAQELENQCKADLEEATGLIPKGIAHEELFEIGSPGPALLELADDNHIGLIVMGSRGLGQIKGIFMGSVSSYMVSRAKCPVFIIK